MILEKINYEKNPYRIPERERFYEESINARRSAMKKNETFGRTGRKLLAYFSGFILSSNYLRPVVFFPILFELSCTGGVNSISSRDLTLYNRKEGNKSTSPLVTSSKSKKNPEVFVKRRDVIIEPILDSDDDGSLFNVNDSKNNLFATYLRPRVGGFLLVKVLNHKSLVNSIEKIEENEDGNSAESIANGKDDEFNEMELIKALPHLGPIEEDEKSVIKNLRMKVVHQFENGDLLLTFKRSSANENNSKQAFVQARLPFDRVISKNNLTTRDLTEIKLLENYKDEIIEKNSTGWEDEYTLRLSGFDETKSKFATKLEEKRNDLRKIKNKLHDRLENLGKERRQMARERDKLIRNKSSLEESEKELKAEIEEQKGKLEEQSSQIEEQKKVIEDLSRPEEKPGDSADD